MLPVVFLVVFLWRTAQSVTIQSTFLDTYLANGTQFSQNTLTLACSNTDFQDPSLLVGNLSYNVICNPPVYQFQTILREFVPKTIRRFTAEYCEIRTVGNFGPAGAVDQSGSATGVGRRLLEWTPDHARRLLQTSDPCAGISDISAATTCCLNNAPDGPTSEACLKNRGFTSSCPNSNQYNSSCVAEQYHYTSTLEWIGAMTKTLERMGVWLQGQQLINSDNQQSFLTLNQTVALQLDVLKGLQNESDTTKSMVVALATNVQGQYDSINTDLRNVLNTLNISYQVSAQQTARENYFENVTSTNFANTIIAAQNMINNISANFLTLVEHVFTARQFQRSSDAAFNRAQRKIGVRRGLADRIAALVQTAKNAGLIPFFDPAFPGSAPGAATAAQQKVLLDSILINFVNGTSPSFTVHQYTLAMYCDVSVVVNDFYTAGDWMDIAAQLGPINCTSQPGAPATNCNCWVQVSHDQCQASSSPTPFDWQTITSQTSMAPYSLVGNAGSYCSGGVTKGPYDGRLIDSVAQWSSLLGALCQASLASSLAGTPAGSGLQPRRVQLVSTRLGTQLLDYPQFPQYTCKPNYDWIFGGFNGAERNLVIVIYTALVQGQQLLLGDQFVWETIVYGGLPNFLTYEEVPFEVLNDNKTYECHRASFLAVSPQTRPVFQVIPTGVQTSVTVQAYAQPPFCDFTGCIFGTPVSSTTTTTAVATTDFANLLPDGSDAIIGEWRTQGIPAMTTVADTPKGGTPLNNVNAIRQGTYTYTWQPIPAGYSLSGQTSYQEDLVPGSGGPWPRTTLLDQWHINNAVPFSAIDGQASQDFTLQPFSNGQCQTTPGDVTNWVCNMFQQFALHPLTNMRQGSLLLQARHWSYIAKIGITTGPVIQRVFDGCPEISYTSLSNGFVQLVITNSLPTPLSVVVRTTNLSPGQCPNVADVTYSLLPKKQTENYLFPCGQQLISAYQQTASGLSPCVQGLNITFNPLSQANAKPFVSPTTNRSIVDDTVQAQLALGQIQLVNFLNSVIPFLAVDFTPALTTPERETTITNLLNAYNASLVLTQQAATTVVTQTALQAIQPFLDSLAQQATAVNGLTSQLAVLQQTFSAQVAKTASDVAKQAVTTNQTVAQIGFQILTDENYIQSLQNQQVGGGACNWCGDKLPGFVASWFCPILCASINWIIGGVIVLGSLLCAYCCCYKTGCCGKCFNGLKAELTQTKEKKTVVMDATPAAPPVVAARYHLVDQPQPPAVAAAEDEQSVTDEDTQSVTDEEPTAEEQEGPLS